MSRYSMAVGGQPVGVAVSGGADSVALVHLLRVPCRVTVLHVNHQLRGAESDADEAFVRALSARLGVPCLVETADPRPLPGNLEANARRLRYEFFRRARTGLGLAAVAVGHTQSDQAETVLFRLLRGAGGTGLAGVAPVSRDGAILRPLIETPRAEVVTWLGQQGHVWREDSSNSNLAFDRNRIRHQLLPQLRREWNRSLDATLARTAAVARDEEEYWILEAARYLPGVDVLGRLVLDIDALGLLPVALQRRVLREAVARVRGDLAGIGLEHIESCRQLMLGERGEGAAALPGLDARRSFGWLLLARPGAPLPPFVLPVPVPSTVGLPGGTHLSVRVVRAEAGPGYNTSARVAWDKIACPVLVRSWKPGDAYRPRGYAHCRKLKDLFQEHKVPSWDRAHWPIIVGEGGVVVWSRTFGPSADLLPREGVEAGELVLEISEERPGG